MSYTIEVYRGRQPAERHFGIYALYVMFFPQLVAGPIERPQNLLHQFREHHIFDYERVTNGLRLMLWGMFKKVVIADRLAPVVNQVYGHVRSYHGIELIIATVSFAFQIYCDFSGYSDIALGAAKILGFDLMINFQRPYFSKSIAEFWRRWHISLSSWFRDYIYIPLGGNKVASERWAYNIFLVFFLSGLWHGANWTFVFWGVLHGLYLILSQLTANIRKFFRVWLSLEKFPVFYNGLRAAWIFTLVSLGWILFRASSLSDAWFVFSHLGSGLPTFIAHLNSYSAVSQVLSFGINFSKPELLIAAVSVLALLLAEYLGRHFQNFWTAFGAAPMWLRWSVYYALVLVILLFGKIGTQQFIYFQF